MNFIKKIKAGSDLLKCRYLKKRIPLVVSFAVTLRCNANCKYCSITERDKKEFSTETAINLIREMSDLGTRKLIFTGGEPLLRKDIGKLIEKSQGLGIEVNLDSNGFLVPKKIEEIKRVDLLVISLDGPENIHDEFRGKGSYKKAIKAIKIAKECDTNVSITSVLTNKNSDYIDWLFEKAKELDVPINFQPIIGNPIGSEKYKEKLSDKKITETINLIKKYKKSYPKLIRPSVKTLDDIIELYTGNGNVNCSKGNIYCRIEGRKLITCTRALEREGVEIEDGLEDAWKKLNKKPRCKFECCTGDIELNNLWNLNRQTILNQLIYDSF